MIQVPQHKNEKPSCSLSLYFLTIVNTTLQNIPMTYLHENSCWISLPADIMVAIQNKEPRDYYTTWSLIALWLTASHKSFPIRISRITVISRAPTCTMKTILHEVTRLSRPTSPTSDSKYRMRPYSAPINDARAISRHKAGRPQRRKASLISALIVTVTFTALWYYSTIEPIIAFEENHHYLWWGKISTRLLRDIYSAPH